MKMSYKAIPQLYKNQMFLLVAVWMFFISGCTKEVDVLLPYSGDKIVVNGILSNTRPVAIRVSHSADPNGPVPLDLTLTDAQVGLYENGNYLEGLQFNVSTKKYESLTGYVPKSGQSYHVIVEAPGYGTAASSPIVMPWPFSSSISGFEKVSSSMNPGTPALKVYFSITDSMNVRDYYAISTEGYISELGKYMKMTFYKQENFLESESNCYYNTSFITVYDDLCINGTMESYLEMELDIIFTDPATGDFTSYIFQHAQISLHRVSAEYFEYIKYTSNVVEGVETVFLEQPSGYSNISNGYGVLAAKFTLDFKINY